MRRPLAVLFFSSACSFSGNNGTPAEPDGPSGMDSQPKPDARPDAMPDAKVCVPGYIDLCNVTARTDMFTPATNGSLNTSTDGRCIVKTQTDDPDLCILYFAKVDIPTGVTITVTGSRALVLASTTTLSIAGTLDVGSRRMRPDRGAASNHSTCAYATNPENDLGGGGGGGAGGTFATQGGAGGTGDMNDNNNQDGNAPGGTPGTALADPPAVLRGGCPGQKAGNATNNGGGNGGASGGAVYLFAKAAINISGTVLATGAGGSGVSSRNGGGGGGSGGTIVIESETQSVLSGTFLATGGGGGEGGASPNVGQDPGESGDDATTAVAAAGGNAIAEGGDGGAGATYSNDAVVPAGKGQDSDGGGGGGGGGNGFIAVRGAGRMLTGAFAPQPSQPL